MKQFNLSLILTAVIVVFGAWPTFAYRPPLDITTTVNSNNISYSVFDPELGKTVSESKSHSQPITNYQNNNGVLAYITNDANGTYCYIKIYEPTQHKFISTGGAPYPQLSNLTVDSGVVAFQDFTPFSGSYGITIVIYSPITNSWNWGGSNISGPTNSLQNQGGVVAFIDGTSVTFTMLDWRYDNKDNSNNVFRHKRVDTAPDTPSSLNITNCTVSYLTGGQLNTWGYDAASGHWVNGIVTNPIAYFLAQASSRPRSPWVWFTDASIGGTSWSWQFGDGSSSTAPAIFHNYNKYGSFNVTQTITGPDGGDTFGKTIMIGGSFVPVNLLLMAD